MKTITITCDLCEQKIEPKSWEDVARSVTILTETACTNPMAKHGDGYQGNKTHFEHLCYPCQRGVAQGISDVLVRMRER